MAKVTSKLQITLPKVLATRYRIAPGDDIEWVAAGDAIRIVRVKGRRPQLGLKQRLHLFDQATKRIAHKKRAANGRRRVTSTVDANQPRGWAREDLYKRGSSDDSPD